MNDHDLKIRKLEERVEQLERFIMENLVFRLDELNDYVHKAPPAGEAPKGLDPSYYHLRHLIDTARVAGWKDRGE